MENIYKWLYYFIIPSLSGGVNIEGCEGMSRALEELSTIEKSALVDQIAKKKAG